MGRAAIEERGGLRGRSVVTDTFILKGIHMRKLMTRRAAALALCAGSILAVSSATAIAQPERARAGAAAAQGETDLPIRKITLYRSGVGYFERAGMVEGTSSVQLRFDADQINDILKSMVLLDLDGGRIETVSYASKEPLSRRLASFGVDISGAPTIADLLRQLRGSEIDLTANGAAIRGTILGVAMKRLPPMGDSPAYDAPTLELLTEDGMRSVALSDVSSYRLVDEELAGELRKALSALAEYRADNVKSVELAFAGRGERRVVVGYIHETPVWKTSYRLVLGEDGEALLQGWAIVENTTDQDWDDVTMSLVAGRPVSFQMDLYEPLFTARPVVPVPTIPGVVSKAYDGGQRGRDRDFAGGERVRLAKRMAPAPEAAPMMDAMEDAEGVFFGVEAAGGLIAMERLGTSAAASGGSIGEVFQFRLDDPVTVERQQSAMIPIVSIEAPARRVSIYSPGDGEHPMRGVELMNDSDLQLLPGPIAVFDSAGDVSAYAGDAQIGHVSPADERLLAYALDLDVVASVEEDGDQNVVGVRIVDGLIEQTEKTVRRVGYSFENKDQDSGRTIIVEHPRMSGWELVSRTEPAERTGSALRFEVELDAAEAGDLQVDAERIVRRRYGIADYDLTLALSYHADGRLSAEVLAVLREVASRQAAIADLERRVAVAEAEGSEISRDQSRIRSNMSSISASSDLYDRYMSKLASQETRLEELVAERGLLTREAEQKRQALRDRLRGLDVD